MSRRPKINLVLSCLQTETTLLQVNDNGKGDITGWNMEVDFGKETCFPRCGPNDPTTIHRTVVLNREKAHCHRADSTIGDKV